MEGLSCRCERNERVRRERLLIKNLNGVLEVGERLTDCVLLCQIFLIAL